MSKLIKVASMMADKPNTKVDDIMKKLKISKTYAYNLMSSARKAIRIETGSSVNSRTHKIRMQATPRDGAAMKLLAVMSSDKPVTQESNSPRIVEEHHTDNVNHPAHYKVGGVETIDFIEAKGLSYHLGNVVKYIARADSKGNREEDLLKARWYLNREIAKFAK